MPAKKKDPFEAFRPSTVEVAVGDGVFVLKTATLDQESRFLSVLDELELDKLIGPITTLMEGSEDDQSGVVASAGGFIKKIRTVGPELWSAGRVVLGKQFAPAVREASIAILDSEHNYNNLVKMGLVNEGDCELGSDGEYLGSTAVRRIVKNQLTLIQAVQIIKSAWTLNGYGNILGNILTMGQAA